jgi:hypothetical protein
VDERAIEIADLEARVSELRHMLNFHVPGATIHAIHDHIAKLQKRILELQFASIPRTNS